MAKAQHGQPGFAEVMSLVHPSEDVAVTVQITGAEVDIHGGADADTVGMVFRILKLC